ncbi:MAG TPA: class I SAM-dependent methyltransferase [Terriglobales bacterium]
MSSARHSHSPTEVLDPVAAYDRLAPYYSQFAKRRARYLRSIEEQIALRIPAGSSSLLDIGAGDGSRTMKIATSSGISRVVLVEASAKMASAAPSGCEIWRTRFEELNMGSISERFDVITCLWNVLGHIQGFENRAKALTAASQLLSPDGLLFVDVIHRYNARSYGLVMTAARWLRDHFSPSDVNGDVTARWHTAAGEISTYGHVFTDPEMRRLAASAGLKCVERVGIDYDTGVMCPGWQGNLLYIFRRSS